ncbi:hypothetical protein GJ744_011624 [Endocarpon pusillum]|uniref:Uncharacterized protein n=1 Tax=Endocarpon pusillum TaxID=364733 RepID=A0A8H7AGH8_9EURO|nr:hypothetical protein GJ744_011624 [Endocarpon pusillum]
MPYSKLNFQSHSVLAKHGEYAASEYDQRSCVPREVLRSGGCPAGQACCVAWTAGVKRDGEGRCLGGR